MTAATYHIGDVFDVMATLPDNSVDLVLTSPPFLALRSYLPADHPDKGKELGSEPTPAEFIDTLLALTAEWERLLTPYGSICVELGDTYAGSKSQDDGVTVDWHRPNAYGSATITRTRSAHDKRGHGWPLDKSLTGIPHLYHLSLAYGRNLLTGQPSPTGQWRVRNVVAWVRPNPPVGALGDKFRPATSYMTVACKARDRWFDLDAVRMPPKSGAPSQQLKPSRSVVGYRGSQSGGNNNIDQPQLVSHPAGAPPLDWWNIPTHPYKGAHYATFPPALCERPIKAMCPAEVCNQCGEPRRRIVGEAEYVKPDGRLHTFHGDRFETEATGANRRKVTGADNGNMSRQAPTLGWTVCDCEDPTYRPGIVLDPFAGSGTTLAVATGHGRDAIGIDLDERNAELALHRVGPMLLEVKR